MMKCKLLLIFLTDIRLAIIVQTIDTLHAPKSVLPAFMLIPIFPFLTINSISILRQYDAG